MTADEADAYLRAWPGVQPGERFAPTGPFEVYDCGESEGSDWAVGRPFWNVGGGDYHLLASGMDRAEAEAVAAILNARLTPVT